MKKLLKKLRTKKLFILIFSITLISFLIGIILPSLLSKDNKELIITSLDTFFTNIGANKINTTKLLYKSLTSNLLLNIFIWVIGISIIGIPLVLAILSFKALTLGFTITSLITTYKLNGILKTIIYLIPNIINLFITFILVYYSISFSIMLFNYLFRKKDYNKRVIVTRYLKLLVLSLLILTSTSVIESYVLPYLFKITI